VFKIKQELSIGIRFSGRLKRLNNIDRQVLKRVIQSIVGKHNRFIKSGAINLDLKQNSEKFRQIPLFECKAKLWNKGKNIVAIGQEYGIPQTVDRALNRIEQKLVQYKEKHLNFRKNINSLEDS